MLDGRDVNRDCARKHPFSKPDQIRQAIRRAVEDEPLWVRILAYQLREGMSDGALERLWRLIK